MMAEKKTSRAKTVKRSRGDTPEVQKPKSVGGRPSAHKGFESVSSMPRIGVRVSEQTKNQIQFFAHKHDMSVNDYILDCIERRVEQENGLVVRDDIYMAHLQQLIDAVKNLDTRMVNLERISTSGFSSIINLTRGDDYLSDDPLLDDNRGFNPLSRIPFESARKGVPDSGIFTHSDDDDDDDEGQ